MNLRIHTPFHMFFLNPDHVAACSLHSLSSNIIISIFPEKAKSLATYLRTMQVISIVCHGHSPSLFVLYTRFHFYLKKLSLISIEKP